MDKKLYIVPCKNTPITSLKVLIDSLYRTCNTLVRRSYARPTFKDPECTKVECIAERRSFEDLLALARTYFPETKETDLMSVLIELGMKYYECSDIGKIVFHYAGTYYVSDGFDNSNINDCRLVDNTYIPSELQKIYEEI